MTSISKTSIKPSSTRPYNGFNGELPFDIKIIKKPLPPNFRLPQFETYDGTFDPIDHIEIFKIALLFQGASDAILYRAFSATLKGITR